MARAWRRSRETGRHLPRATLRQASGHTPETGGHAPQRHTGHAWQALEAPACCLPPRRLEGVISHRGHLMTKVDFPHPRRKLLRGPWGRCKGRWQSFPRWPGALEQTAAPMQERSPAAATWGCPEVPVGRGRSCVVMKSLRPQGLPSPAGGPCPTRAAQGFPHPATCPRWARLLGWGGPSALFFGPGSDSRRFTPCVPLDSVTQPRLGFKGSGIFPFRVPGGGGGDQDSGDVSAVCLPRIIAGQGPKSALLCCSGFLGPL